MHVRRVLKPSPLQPILALIPETLPTKEEEKSKFLSIEPKARAGQPARSTTYKKYFHIFKEGMLYQWIELVKTFGRKIRSMDQWILPQGS